MVEFKLFARFPVDQLPILDRYEVTHGKRTKQQEMSMYFPNVEYCPKDSWEFSKPEIDIKPGPVPEGGKSNFWPVG